MVSRGDLILERPRNELDPQINLRLKLVFFKFFFSFFFFSALKISVSQRTSETEAPLPATIVFLDKEDIPYTLILNPDSNIQNQKEKYLPPVT